MHIGRRYQFSQTLYWSRLNFIVPLIWAILATLGYSVLELTFLALPTLPMSLVGIAVAFYLGFKNNASYDRLWEARKIWGAIVNASRSWAYGSRDLVAAKDGAKVSESELAAIRVELVRRHIAWLDALRHALRQIKSWEHQGPTFERLRHAMGVPEFKEELTPLLEEQVGQEEAAQVQAQINTPLHLLSNQSRRLAELRERGLLDGFAHLQLQQHLDELMTQQGKAERIKNFPFPRQYATVNFFFAVIFAVLVPFALVPEFAALGPELVWLTVPFSTVVSWVFLTTDKIGDWSENPFEGLANDVPITSMARGIERDMLQVVGVTDLRPAREPQGKILY